MCSCCATAATAGRARSWSRSINLPPGQLSNFPDDRGFLRVETARGTPALALLRGWLSGVNLRFDSSCNGKESAEGRKKPDALNRVDELCDFLRLPRRELRRFNHVFGHLAEILHSPAVFDFDDSKILTDQLAPHDGEARGIDPAGINHEV